MKDAKPTPQQEHPQAAPTEKTYQVTGLQVADRMPINFEGREYDLANLTEPEADYLLGFPGQIPWLKRN